MKKILVIVSVLVGMGMVQRTRAQALLGVTGPTMDTIGPQFYAYPFQVYNASSQVGFYDTLIVTMAVDTLPGAAGGLKEIAKVKDQFILGPFAQSPIHGFVIPKPEDVFKGGINVIIIWPATPVNSTSSFILLDSLTIPVIFDSTHYPIPNGITEKTVTDYALVFPNPTTSYFYIKSANSQFEVERVRLSNIFGQVVKDERFNGQIDVNGLAAGTYTLELIGKDAKLIRYKVIKE